jgi:FkbM family methyltransferase
MIYFIKNFFKRKKNHDVVKLLNPRDLFFDIGAHLGNKSKQFLDKNLKAVMVEPLPECVKQLKLRFKNNDNIKIIQKAVGKESGNMDLEVNSKMPTTSTMAKHWKEGRFSNQQWDKKISVDVTTLDILIKNHGLPNYIKIDVEGFELDVLQGLSQKAGIISFEFTSEFFDQTIKCLNYLKEINYNEFNFSIGERRKFYADWLTVDDLIKNLETEIGKDKLLWGDVYCR